MTRHMYRSLLHQELLKVDPVTLIASLVDYEKATTFTLENRTIDTHEALERITTNLGFIIVTQGETLHLTPMI